MNLNNTTSDSALAESTPTPDPKGKTAKAIANTVYAGPGAIDERLTKLDREWTIGRAIKVTAALCMLIGLGLALFVNIWWLLLPIAFSVLLLHYTVSRDSILTGLFHKLGLRSSTNIQHERTALKALRGDFRHLPTAFDKDDKEALERLEGEGRKKQTGEERYARLLQNK
jgi:hypothetical protein